MPSACGYTWPAFLDDIIRDESELLDVPIEFPFGIIAAESAFNIDACGDVVPAGQWFQDVNGHWYTIWADSNGVPWRVYGCGGQPFTAGRSHGLMQLNTAGGQGSGYTYAQLHDARTNVRIGLQYISGALNVCNGVYLDPDDALACVATRSGHPGLVPFDDPRVVTIVGLINCFTEALRGFDPLGFLRFLGCPLSLLLLPFMLAAGPFRRRRSPCLSVDQLLRADDVRGKDRAT